MLRTTNPQHSLWEAILPDACLGLPAELARVDRHVAGLEALVESIIDTLEGQLGLEQRGARTRPGSTPGSGNGCWPWPQWCGSAGSSAPSTSARWWPTTTESITTQSESII